MNPPTHSDPGRQLASAVSAMRWTGRLHFISAGVLVFIALIPDSSGSGGQGYFCFPAIVVCVPGMIFMGFAHCMKSLERWSFVASMVLLALYFLIPAGLSES